MGYTDGALAFSSHPMLKAFDLIIVSSSMCKLKAANFEAFFRKAG